MLRKTNGASHDQRQSASNFGRGGADVQVSLSLICIYLDCLVRSETCEMWANDMLDQNRLAFRSQIMENQILRNELRGQSQAWVNSL